MTLAQHKASKLPVVAIYILLHFENNVREAFAPNPFPAPIVHMYLASYPGPPFNFARGGPGVQKYII